MLCAAYVQHRYYYTSVILKAQVIFYAIIINIYA